MIENSKMCQYYLQGACNYGNKCRFLHSTEHYKPKLCPYFLKGRCKLQRKCPDIHDGVKYDLKCFAVRHGESEFNKRLEVFAATNPNIQCEEAKQFQFDESLIDAPLTELGRKQSLISHKKYQPIDIEMIFVSPLNRALQTCDIIFKGRAVEVVVIPEFAEVLSMVCDVSKPIKDKIKKYKQFDFSLFEELDNNWQVPCISLQHDIPFDKITSPQESMDEIFGLMKQCFPERLESDQDCRQRVIRGTARMKRICQENKVTKVAIVAHRRVIRELSKSFGEKYGIGLQNAQILELDL